MPWIRALAKFWTDRPLLVLPGVAISQHMAKRSPLDDSRISAHAWARYKRLMKGMAALTTTVVVLTLGAFYWQNGVVSVHFFIATALGIGVMMMLTALSGRAVSHDGKEGSPVRVGHPLTNIVRRRVRR